MMGYKEKRFCEGLVRAVRDGWDPWGPYVHAFLETDGFRKVVGEHNYWGIKRGEAWDGLVVRRLTKEWSARKGQMVSGYAFFADWSDVDVALLWYRRLVERVYPQAFRWRSSPTVFFRYLIENRVAWATDPYYKMKLARTFASLLADGDVIRTMNEIQEVGVQGGTIKFS